MPVMAVSQKMGRTRCPTAAPIVTAIVAASAVIGPGPSRNGTGASSLRHRGRRCCSTRRRVTACGRLDGMGAGNSGWFGRPTPLARRRWATPVVAAGLLIAAACGSDDAGVDAASTPVETSAAPTTTSIGTSTTASVPQEPADPVAWRQVDVGAVSPPARSEAVLVATPAGELWLHGGRVDGEPLGDLWRFDGTGWEQIAVDGGPAPRSEHAAVWDAERNRLVLGLGEGPISQVFDDTWAFDPSTGAWSQLATGGPAARYGACAVLDGGGRMVVTHGFSSSQRFGDTWAFDLATATWSDITPAGTRPSDRCLHACGYDPATDELILFGGRNDDEPYLGDTWRLGSAGWTEIAGDGPSPRARSRAAFTNELLVLGGSGPDGFPADAWVLRDAAWEPGPADVPADREASAVAVANGEVWLFGGEGPTGPLADLWRSG